MGMYLRAIRVVALVLCAWLLPSAAAMAATAPGDRATIPPACHAYSSESVDVAGAGALEWSCGDDGWRDGQPVTWLRFSGWDAQSPPTSFASRITGFNGISIAAIDGAGAVRERDYSMDDARPIVAGAVFTLPLPAASADTTAYLVRIERPHSVTIASDARLSSDPQLVAGSLSAIIVLVLALGMLLTPLLFDINFYLVLRERFVLLHAAMVLAMIFYVLFSEGLITFFVSLPVAVLALLGPLCWPLGTGAAAFFMNAFLEREMLPRRMRRLISLAGWWIMLVPGFCALKFDFSQPFDNRLYFIAFAPVIPLYGVAIIMALMRGSRAARFLAAAWLPIVIAGIERILRGMGAYSGHSPIDQYLVIAMALEVIIIALGVADRFLAVRRERDQAIGEAQLLSEISERDVLTGLLNRRALQDRFDGLRRDGFVNIALFDLDRFKEINDRFGHQTGDKVLRAAAGALMGDSDSRVFRIGGEEFLVLFRGAHAQNRAEAARQAIAPRVASEVPGLDRIVTASVGMIEMSFDTMPDTSFADLYSRADRLLYEAKESGRNRMVSERLRVFRRRKGDRRKEAA